MNKKLIDYINNKIQFRDDYDSAKRHADIIENDILGHKNIEQYIDNLFMLDSDNFYTLEQRLAFIAAEYNQMIGRLEEIKNN